MRNFASLVTRRARTGFVVRVLVKILIIGDGLVARIDRNNHTFIWVGIENELDYREALVLAIITL